VNIAFESIYVSFIYDIVNLDIIFNTYYKLLFNNIYYLDFYLQGHGLNVQLYFKQPWKMIHPFLCVGGGQKSFVKWCILPCALPNFWQYMRGWPLDLRELSHSWKFPQNPAPTASRLMFRLKVFKKWRTKFSNVKN